MANSMFVQKPQTAREQARSNEDWATVGEILAAGLPSVGGERHPIARTGERDEIPSHVRAAIWYRDGGRCEMCFDATPHNGPTHIDHILPWSAGGGDTSDNLRLLCELHNVQRSNFVDHTPPRRPVTWWCVNCYSREGYGWIYDGVLATWCPTHEHNHGCRVARAYNRALLAHIKDGSTPTNWHEREPMLLADATTLAYCAHCDAPGMTDQPL